MRATSAVSLQRGNVRTPLSSSRSLSLSSTLSSRPSASFNALPSFAFSSSSSSFSAQYSPIIVSSSSALASLSNVSVMRIGATGTASALDCVEEEDDDGM
tara:strand:+ start:30 stop:329 length:300 start_codon:yes stop_codon:yes gene_type:complete